MNDFLSLTIAMRGPMTKEAVDLRALGNTLINIQSLLDRSYCHYTNCKKIGAAERNNFKLVAYDVQRGSIIFKAGLAAFTLQQSLAITQTIDPKLIFNTTVSAFKFLKNYLSQTNKNQIPKVQITNSPGAMCIINEGDNNITISSDTAEVAKLIRQPLRRLASTFNYGEKGEISIESQDLTDSISMTNEIAPLFKGRRVVSDIPLHIVGIVKGFHADSISGQFEVLTGSVIPPGKYQFSIDPAYKNDSVYFIDSLKNEPIHVTANVEYDISSTTESTITKLFLRQDRNI